MTIRITLGFLMAVACTQAAAVNKCTGPDGKVVFQDAPCEGRGEPVKVWSSGPSSSSAPGADASELRARRQAEIDGIHQRADIRAAIERGEPMVGMTRTQLEQALGTPDLVNADTDGGVVREQIIFERPGQAWYVYTENGIVTSIQNRPSVHRARAGRCPTPQEIRSMETSASSITLSERERMERLRQIGEARRCSR